MKWIIAAAAAVLLAGFGLLAAQFDQDHLCQRLPQYNQLPGREFIFQRDCYIFKFKHHNTDWPLVGANAPGSAMSVPDCQPKCRPSMSASRCPRCAFSTSPVPAIVSRSFPCVVDETRHGAHVTFEILFTDEAERRYPRLDAFWILDHTPEARGEAPSISPITPWSA